VIVVFFTCNHCPYVTGSDEVTRATVERFKTEALPSSASTLTARTLIQPMVLIHMVKRMNEHHFPWVYARDKSQKVAVAYGALRTPHFYVFDSDRKLVYTGRGVDNPRHAAEIHVNNLDMPWRRFWRVTP